MRNAPVDMLCKNLVQRLLLIHPFGANLFAKGGPRKKSENTTDNESCFCKTKVMETRVQKNTEKAENELLNYF